MTRNDTYTIDKDLAQDIFDLANGEYDKFFKDPETNYNYEDIRIVDLEHKRIFRSLISEIEITSEILDVELIRNELPIEPEE